MSNKEEKVYYFAYASNMDPREVKKVIKEEPKKIGCAILENYEFVYSGCSPKRKGPSANIIPKNGSRVYGVLYEILKSKLNRLQSNEGFYEDYIYKCEKVSVKDVENGNIYGDVNVLLKTPDEEGFPSYKYRDKIVCAAYKAEKIPKDYIEKYLNKPKYVNLEILAKGKPLLLDALYSTLSGELYTKEIVEQIACNLQIPYLFSKERGKNSEQQLQREIITEYRSVVKFIYEKVAFNKLFHIIFKEMKNKNNSPFVVKTIPGEVDIINKFVELLHKRFNGIKVDTGDKEAELEELKYGDNHYIIQLEISRSLMEAYRGKLVSELTDIIRGVIELKAEA